MLRRGPAWFVLEHDMLLSIPRQGIVALRCDLIEIFDNENDHPKPSVWAADSDHLVAAVTRGYEKLDWIDEPEGGVPSG
jgi:hypothetical protein